MAKAKKDFLWKNSNNKLRQLNEQDIELIVFNSSKPDFEKLENRYYEIVKVYNRVPIIKEVKSKTINHPKIFSYKDEIPSPELIDLAKLAGKEGRFGRDHRISQETYDKIFEEWITNSVKRIVADEVLVYKVDEKVVGFGTLKIEGDNGFGPLFAVNRDYEGKGVSFALMRAIENKLIEKKCKYLVSGTQEINKKALGAFRRFGFELQTPEFVYHLWKINYNK
ncbi:GNAT family N-acetyltransferase [Gramella sp. MAR_2010_147]|uniref:GNAT family N-acetyltransferase n=1 Tax=Gramella sp. MAR_2010_147 TaxID=1250205 RepID=UPI0012FDF8A3|nr:GNAT family N-acetyltransferase [Gramella sp. MAR_2010_147]